MNAQKAGRPGASRQATLLAAAIVLSALGMAFHAVREFGYAGLISLGTGMIPVTAVQISLFLVWMIWPKARTAAGVALVLTGVLQLIGGGLLSVLPLPFLPFAPEQSLSHYLSHAVLGFTQLPLILVPLRGEAGRKTSHMAAG